MAMDQQESTPSSKSMMAKGQSMSDLVSDMKTASKDVLLATAQQVVADKLSDSHSIDPAEEERIPKLHMNDVKIGRIVGKGGFCTVQEVRVVTGGKRGAGRSAGGSRGYLSTDGSLSSTGSLSKRMNLFRSSKSAQNETSKKSLMAGESDWASISEFDKIGNHMVVDLNAELQLSHGSNSKYVIKKLSSDQPDRITFLKGTVDLAMESKYLSSLSHENIIKLYGVSADGPFRGNYFLLLEKMDETLSRRIKKWMDTDRQCKGITSVLPGTKKKLLNLEGDRLQAAHDIARGGHYLHQKQIVFRDLKPDNIGFNSMGVLKIFDFGLAKELRPAEQTEDGLYRMTGFTGAPRYMAPEVGLKKPYTLSADVYSWSMILWYILALEPPFGLYTEKMIQERVFRRGARPKQFSAWPKRVAEIQRQAWNKDLNERPTFKAISEVLKEEMKDIDPKRAAGIELKE